MSEAYLVEGITVTPIGGGFYELSHPSLEAPVKERGKENADARATELGRALASVGDESGDAASLAPQGDLPPAPPAPAGDAPASASEVADLKAQIKALTDLVTRTVIAQGEAPAGPVPGQISNAVQTAYGSILSAEAKDKLREMGVETTDIILEEDETIPPTGLFVSVNGRAYMISPGEPVTVPNFLLEVLDNAVMSTPIVDPKSQKVLDYRNRSKYPYKKL